MAVDTHLDALAQQRIRHFGLFQRQHALFSRQIGHFLDRVDQLIRIGALVRKGRLDRGAERTEAFTNRKADQRAAKGTADHDQQSGHVDKWCQAGAHGHGADNQCQSDDQTDEGREIHVCRLFRALSGVQLSIGGIRRHLNRTGHAQRPGLEDPAKTPAARRPSV